MSADTTFSTDPTPANTNNTATLSDASGGGAGRGGSDNTAQGPLVVVQQPRNASPPRPTPRANQNNTDNSLRNGYAAISHSVSGETAAIGIGFLVAGPIGAIVGGAALPALVAASMWRARRREHDENTNDQANSGGSDSTKSGRDRSGSGGGRGNAGGRGNGGGRHRTPTGPGSGRHKTPKGPGAGKGTGNGTGLDNGKNRKPKIKDPVADKLSKAGKGLADKLKNRGKNDAKDKPGKHDKNRGGKDTTDTGTKNSKDPKSPKTRKDHRGDYPDDRRWRGRGHKDQTDKPRKDKRQKGPKGGDTTSATARDGLAPIKPNGGSTTEDEIFDAEIVDDGPTPNPDPEPGEVIDGEVIDEDRIALVRAKREKQRRREALTAGKRAEKEAARDGTMGDPLTVKLERIRTENQRIDLELRRQDELLALAAGTEQRRSTPVNYPVATTTPGSHTAGVAVARQIDARGTIAYRLLLAMAEQLASGGHNDADMADHIFELAHIPTMCRDLALAVREAAAALSKTAPLHPSVIKHLNSAAVSAITAARMADTIITVFVQAHREDIYRVMNPRTGEERWNIRNAAGTLDAAKLRAAILSAGQQRLALPAGTTNGTAGHLVPASGADTKKLINLMKGFDRGHMVTCLSEVDGAAHGVEIVADAVTKLYRRMANTWPTENVVDDTVLATASKVKNVSVELRKAIKAAQRAHQRELKLNAKPRKGARAESAWDVVRGR